MRDKTREEQDRCRGLQVKRVVDNGSQVEVIPDVIECHDNHDKTSQDINGFNAAGFQNFGHGEIV